jgi:hypothetical protein
MLRILFFPAEQRIEKQQNPANHNGGIGNIEIRPVVVNDVHFKKIDHVAEAQAVISIAQSASQDERQRNRSGSDSAAKLQQRNQHGNRRQHRKDKQHPAHARRRTRIVEQTEGRARVFHMTDGEDVAITTTVDLPSSIRVDASHFVIRSATMTSSESSRSQPLESLVAGHAVMRFLPEERPSDRAPPSSVRRPSASANPHPVCTE